MLIALAGGNRESREAISARLVDSGKAGLRAFSSPEPKASHPYRRLRILREALQGGDLRSRCRGVLVTHCLTEHEAKLVRELGGVVWHIYERLPAVVVIRNGDAIVTIAEDGFAHVRSPLEALSDLLLARAA